MNFSRIYAIFIRQWFIIKSNPTRLSGIFVWIVLDIVQWGFISKYIGSFGSATFSFVSVILGAIILWNFTSRMQHGIMTAFLEDIWTQNFINFFASPLKVKEYLSGLILTSIATSTIGLSMMLVLAELIFGYNIFQIGLMVFPFVFILFVFGTAMGVFITALIFRLGPAAEWLGWPIPFLLSIVAGVYYPISTLPATLQIIAKIIPASYIFEGIRTIVINKTFSMDLGIDLLIAFLLSLVYLLAAFWFFVKVYQRNLKTGSITRFSAEDV